MPYKSSATVTSKGQVTVPANIRERLGLKAGDRLDFHLTDSGKLTVVATKRRSILESRDDLPRLTLGRPLTQRDIDDAIGDEMVAQEMRIRRQRPR
ncbi:MAG TPA: AbrB/MazE/SpoVT family DNA-binding domain-containing protein [Bradyrhizobium sp.]|jgi:antitoxin PrlF|nr:AbrB/MazE/SpoVT family DNA-binding domain-containing protein [Bradyrhizobium sp.]